MVVDIVTAIIAVNSIFISLVTRFKPAPNYSLCVYNMNCLNIYIYIIITLQMPSVSRVSRNRIIQIAEVAQRRYGVNLDAHPLSRANRTRLIQHWYNIIIILCICSYVIISYKTDRAPENGSLFHVYIHNIILYQRGYGTA